MTHKQNPSTFKSKIIRPGVLILSLQLVCTLLLTSKPVKPLVVPSQLFHIGTFRGSSLDLHILESTPAYIKFPFRKVRNLILLEGVADQLDGYFILDTGAPYLVLNKTYFRESKIKTEWMAGGVGGTQSAAFSTQIQELKIQELSWTDVNADVLSLSHIENKLGAKILGLLGNALFEKYEMEINLRDQVMILYTLDKKGRRIQHPEKCNYRNSTCRGKLKPHDSMILLEAKIEGKKLTLCMDTGAEMLVLNKVLKKKVLNQVLVDKRMILNGTDGNRIEVLGGVLYELNLPGADLCDIPTIIASLDDMGNAYKIHIDGMIGHSLLEKGIFSVNFVIKKWSFRPFNEEEE